ncbi:hypothetical protein L596_007252 [Steinernema carpocapsae]|uniref:Uncharacterized protein n=1 Tax=Steinernema carpocapsae TaxID=34508 RepID=A0A4U5P8S8_STECR|nr:hypothetical protein L596_007252 [Steinernema carpocapsae]
MSIKELLQLVANQFEVSPRQLQLVLRDLDAIVSVTSDPKSNPTLEHLHLGCVKSFESLSGHYKTVCKAHETHDNSSISTAQCP